MQIPATVVLEKRMNGEAHELQAKPNPLSVQLRQLDGQPTQLVPLRILPEGQLAVQDPLISIFDELAHDKHS
jgi:hypothetical protein